MIFENEKYDQNATNHHEEVTSVKEVVKIIFELVKKPNMIKLIGFFFVTRLGFFVTEYLQKLWLLDDMGFSRSKFAMFDMILLPIEILGSMWIASIFKQNPMNLYKYCLYAKVAADLLIVNVIYYNY